MEVNDGHIRDFRIAVDAVHPLGNKCWSALSPLMYTKELDKNGLYSKEGQLINELGFVCEGVMRIYYLNEKGKEWNKHFLLENDFVASGISPEKKSITSIQALTKTQLICLPFKELIKLSATFSEINSFIQNLTFSYLEQKQQREISLLSEEAVNNYQNFRKAYPGLEHRIQHYHIASYLGITPTQLSRLRRKMEIGNSHLHM